MADINIPVIAIDGPAASGKGTVAQQTAARLNFHYLDSGKIYRALAFRCLERQVAAEDIAGDADKIAQLARRLADNSQELVQLQRDPALMRPHIGQMASALATQPAVRELLLPLQRAMRQPPGLVADGRDMGTVVFPDAPLRVFLTADVAARAKRRQKQLQEKQIYATIAEVCADITQRDEQDQNRAVAPLKPSADALAIDSTHLAIGDIVETILRAYRNIAF